MSTLLQYMKASKRRKTSVSAKTPASGESVHIACLTLSFQEPPISKTKIAEAPLPLGDFSVFPAEVFYHILYVSPLTILGILSQTSRAMRDYILEFMDTKKASSKITPDIYPGKESEFVSPRSSKRKRESLRKHYRDLAFLMKKSTCLFPTSERLRRVGGILNKLREAHVIICNCHGSAHAYSCYGEFLHTFVAGWEDDEKTKAYIAIQGASLLRGRINEVLHCDMKGDQREKYEWYIKVFCRQLFIDRAEGGEKTFWIFQIMGSLSRLEQARLLYIIFGPQAYDKELKEPFIDWRLFLDDSVAAFNLKGLGSVLKLLTEDPKKLWSTESIIGIMKHLIEFPAQWRLENVCKLLRIAGKKVCYSFMEELTKEKSTPELYVTLYQLWQVSVSEGRISSWEDEKDNWFLSLLRHLCAMEGNEQGTSQMIDGLVTAFEDNVVMDIAEHRYASDTDAEEMEETLRDQMKPVMALLKILMGKNLKEFSDLDGLPH